MRSDAIKTGIARAPARAMFKAMGLTDADLEKPLVAVANTWTEVTPCNVHLRELAVSVKEGIREAGGTPLEFNTIVVSDGIAMGSEGMRSSLVSREIVADSIELVVNGHLLDAVVAISGCDKTIPGTVMALARLDLPSLMILRRLHPSRPLPGKRRHHPGRLRGGRSLCRGPHDRERPSISRGIRRVPARAPAAASSPPTRCRRR